MNTHHLPIIHKPKINTQSGVALVTTLAILVLLLGLTIALFLSASTELRMASLYKNSQGLRELADTSVNLVQAQIKDATSSTATNAPAQRQTWASQPGMIRTYANGTNAVTSYKLYSWADPRPSGDATDTVPATWSQNKALYTDLNEPLPDSQDPSNTNLYRYPIAYPPPAGTNAPLGYSVTNAPVATTGSITNSIPMPVQWLYVLQSGSLVYPTSSSGTTVTVPGASNANPIVARVAFWTDDETSKVNVNTSAGGLFWMTPYFATTSTTNLSTGEKFAHFQPMQFEFQRFPGHPARTDLRAVFPDLSPTGATNSLYAFTPRVQYGGSTAALASGINSANNTNDVKMDSDRLFASVGEVRFSSSNSTNRADFPAPDGNWPDRIERTKFLITASSRAPETTQYGTPRIAIWPVPFNSATNRRTPYDSLIAFCSSLPGTSTTTNAYYFTRSSNDSPTNDIAISRNSQLLAYLDNMMATTAIPGSGSAGFPSKGSAADRAQIQTGIFDYIRSVNLVDSMPAIDDSSGGSWSYGIISYTRGNTRHIVVPSIRTVAGITTRGFGRSFTLSQFGLIFAATAAYSDPDSNVVENKSLQSSPGTNNATLLTANQTRVMALPVFELASPSAGFSGFTDKYISLKVRGLDGIQVSSATNTATALLPAQWEMTNDIRSEGGKFGGFMEYQNLLRNPSASPPGNQRYNPLISVNGFTNGVTNGYPVSRAFTVTSDQPMTVTSTGNIAVDLVTDNSTNTVIIPPFTATVNRPSLNLNPVLLNATQHPKYAAWSFHNESIGITNFVPLNYTTTGINPTNISIVGRTSATPVNSPSQGFVYNGDSVVTVAAKAGDYRLPMVNPGGGSANFEVVPSLPGGQGGHRFYSPNITTNSVSTANIPLINVAPNVMGNVGLTPSGSTDPYLPSSYPSGVAQPLTWGDFDSGQGFLRPGPYVNKPNEGSYQATSSSGFSGAFVPYFKGAQSSIDTGNVVVTNKVAWSSPNREIASPVAFGSLPSAALQGRPWQNLLFRPAPTSAGGTLHPGAAGRKWDGASGSGAPPDHYLLDYFWMPVVEPWAVSETFSTAGKINLNYTIAPFSYIKRETTLHALLDTEVIPAVPSTSGSWGGGYEKINVNSAARILPANSTVIERQCNVPETLQAISDRRGTNALFSSASQICEIHLIPKGINNSTNSGPTAAAISSFWADNQMTGDDLRELPYNNIYSRLTTKSNTFTIHYRVQVLKKTPGSDATLWDEMKDKSVSELRGSTLIERYLDPNATYPDYATSFSSAASLDSFYRFRTLQRSDFTP